jgi:hypothetical protein
MHRRDSTVWIAIVAFACRVAQADAIAPQEPVTLFNGRDLGGFYTFLQPHGRDRDPNGVFTVTAGELRISGVEYGCLTSRDEYHDYVLVAEYRWGDETFAPRATQARDSGILVHSTGADGGYRGVWMHSLECQLIEGGTGDFIVVGDKSPRFAITAPAAAARHGDSPVYEAGGAPVTIDRGRINWWGRDPAWKDVLGFRGPRDVEAPVGDWNQLVCVARGDTLEVRLNGVVVNRATRVRPTAGRIQIQSEGAEVFFRRIELLPLDAELPMPGREGRATPATP